MKFPGEENKTNTVKQWVYDGYDVSPHTLTQLVIAVFMGCRNLRRWSLNGRRPLGREGGDKGRFGGWVSCPGGFLLLSASCPPWGKVKNIFHYMLSLPWCFAWAHRAKQACTESYVNQKSKFFPEGILSGVLVTATRTLTTANKVLISLCPDFSVYGK